MTENSKSKVRAYVQVLRCHQWLKSGFVLAPLLFSGEFRDLSKCGFSLLACISFCAVASGVYAFNDLCDRKEDQQHRQKKDRPIAKGLVSTTEAAVLSGVLISGGLILGTALGVGFITILFIYITINALYSLGLKHVAILDVMIISGGFVLRILGGSVAIEVEASHWLILCTLMISVFLGFSKRRAEIVTAGKENESSRIVLKDYSLAFLDQVISMVTGATILCYALYSVDEQTIARFGTRGMLITVPFVMYGLFRYLYLVYHLQEGEDATRACIRDVPMIINLILWVVFSLLVVGYGDTISGFF